MTLKEWLTYVDINQADVARMTGVTAVNVNGYYHRRVTPTLRIAIKLHNLSYGAVSFVDMLAIKKEVIETTPKTEINDNELL